MNPPDDEITFLPAIKGYYGQLVELLNDADLCTDDLENMNGLLMVAIDHQASDQTDVLIGGFGLEICDSDALLRSVVVADASRGKRFGIKIVSEALSYAEALGFENLYLLTTTADGFFGKYGFLEIDRGSVPEAVGATLEFKTFCPDSAVCMKLSLK